MNKLFLIGGGWDPDGMKKTFGLFASEVINIKDYKLLLVLEDNDEYEETKIKYLSVLSDFSLSAEKITVFKVNTNVILTYANIKAIDPTAIFVGGGLTPLYQECLCRNKEWVNFIIENNIPYCGFSAGSAIAANTAIVGGWKIKISNTDIAILDEDLAEDLEYLDIRNGLGLIDFSIDVHGSQWGTLTRLLHAVDQNKILDGLVIDENTMIILEDSKLYVSGMGQVYYVRKNHLGIIQVYLFRDGNSITR